jgi:hypothetical protein
MSTRMEMEKIRDSYQNQGMGNSKLGGMNLNPVVDKTPMDNAIDRLQRAIDFLSMTASQVENKFGPVLEPQTADKATAPTAPPSSLLVNKINDMASYVEIQVNVLNSIVDRATL